MRQHQVLLVADADFRHAVAVHQIGQRIELLVAAIAGHPADRLKRNRSDGMARRAVAMDVGCRPVREIVVMQCRLEFGRMIVQRFE